MKKEFAYGYSGTNVEIIM